MKNNPDPAALGSVTNFWTHRPWRGVQERPIKSRCPASLGQGDSGDQNYPTPRGKFLKMPEKATTMAEVTTRKKLRRKNSRRKIP